MSTTCPVLTVRAKCKLPKHPSAGRLYYIDCKPELADGDTLDGVTLTMTEETSHGDLVIAAPSRLTADKTIKGHKLYANQAATVRISGGSTGADEDGNPVDREYDLLLLGSTTDGDDVAILCTLVLTKG